MAIVYDIFAGSSSGGPIDYTTVITTVSGLSVSLAALGLSSSTRFGVRARDTVSGFSDLNTDAQVLIVVDGSGNDVTARPNAPECLRATAKANGSALIEWAYPYPRKPPTGFHVYLGTGGTVNYGTVVATIPFSGPFGKSTLTGLTGGTAYVVSVRAYNAVGEEPNTIAVSFTADTTPPANVVSLAATVTI